MTSDRDPRLADSVISTPLRERMREAGAADPIGIIVELRTGHPSGIEGAAQRAIELIAVVSGGAATVRPVGGYLATALTAEQITKLWRRDAEARTGAVSRYAIHRIWPNFQVRVG